LNQNNLEENPMKYTSLFVAATMASALVLPAAANAADIEIRIAHGSTPQYHMHKALEKFASLVEEGSDQRIKVTIFPSAQIAADTGMVEAVLAESIEMAVEPPSFFAKWDGAFETPELPFIYPNRDVAFKVLNSEAGDALMDHLTDMGLVGLGWMEMGQRQLTNNVRPIVKPEDLEGIKLRTMKVPTHIIAFRALGANPTPLNFGEVYAGLQLNVIDGQENPTSQIYAQKFYEVQKYMTVSDHILGLYLPVINADFFHNLSEADQTLIRDSMQAAINYDFTIVAAEDAAFLKEMKEAGLEVTVLTPEQKKAFIDKVATVRDQFRDRVGADIYDLWMKKIAEFSE